MMITAFSKKKIVMKIMRSFRVEISLFSSFNKTTLYTTR
jgi:hypothetical protein